MKAVILDAATLGQDIDLAPIQTLVSDLIVHSTTTASQVDEHLGDAQLVLSNKVVLGASQLQGRKAVFVLATGTNNVDQQAALALSIPVYNVENYGADYVAQHTWMLILSLAGRYPQYQAAVAQGQWQANPYFCLNTYTTTQLHGKHLVLQGSGHIGRRVASIAESFGMRVSVAARPGDSTDSRPPLQQLLPEADVLSFHCPLTSHTRHLLNSDTLAQVKPGCLVVNCARGGVIDEGACLTALRAGDISGLATDVLPTEPPVAGHPLLDALAEPLNLVITPHNAWISPEARHNIVRLTALNMQRFLAG
ncbi:NAD(P)-dependent oxidoreductase [Halioxenophilus aromaticivorans]|uniref:2-hydroxyacid dehydrogenase n=1 Tax=Halioxenophilus aromaticivorans TaxID=1306992 RepID=A0AAV3U230_9ALTE